VTNVNGELSAALFGRGTEDQAALDRLMIELNGASLTASLFELLACG
jgi:enolase